MAGVRERYLAMCESRELESLTVEKMVAKLCGMEHIKNLDYVYKDKSSQMMFREMLQEFIVSDERSALDDLIAYVCEQRPFIDKNVDIATIIYFGELAKRGYTVRESSMFLEEIIG